MDPFRKYRKRDLDARKRNVARTVFKDGPHLRPAYVEDFVRELKLLLFFQNIPGPVNVHLLKVKSTKLRRMAVRYKCL